MKIGIMQPYLFPYLGYFQLIKAVNVFVLYDDVNFINRGWINRNRILWEDEPKMFTLRLVKKSQNKKINEIMIEGDNVNRIRLTEVIRNSYLKAPMFSEVYPLVKEILLNEEDRLSEYLLSSIVKICKYLEISTKIICSSDLKYDRSTKGQYKIIELNKLLKSSHYINPIGGQSLYAKEFFFNEKMKFNFIKMNEIAYTQFDNIFVPNLSIIDVLMFNDRDVVSEMLDKYSLI